MRSAAAGRRAGPRASRRADRRRRDRASCSLTSDSGTCTSASSSQARPSVTSVMPGLTLRPKKRCATGRRRSRSTRITRLPDRANVTARLATDVDLPSAGFALVTMNDFAPRSRFVNSMFVASSWKASVSGASGVTSIASSSRARRPRSGSNRRPSSGMPRCSSTSAAVRTRVLSASRIDSSPAPRRKPKKPPRTALRIVCGWTWMTSWPGCPRRALFSSCESCVSQLLDALRQAVVRRRARGPGRAAGS